jgi:hypothetical protein
MSNTTTPLSRTRWIIPAFLLVGGWMLVPRASVARPSYTKMERKECAFCHLAEGGKISYAGEMKLTDAGRYYKDHRTLKGFQEKPPNKDSGSSAPSK